MYCIMRRSGQPLPEDLDIDLSSAIDTVATLGAIRERLGDSDLIVLRDGDENSAMELRHDVARDDVRQVLDAEVRLPSTFRPARRGEPDLTIGPLGVTAVWKPENPEDRFE